MMNVFAQAEPVWLMSLAKPILFLVVVIGWAWVVSFLDKDAERHFLQRRLWNGVQVGVGATAFLLLLVVPYFWLWLPLALLLLAGSIGGYVFYRNMNVKPEQQWRLNLETVRGWQDQREAKQAQKHATVRLLRRDGAPVEVPSGADPAAAAHELLDQTLTFALPRGADRFEVLADANRTALSVRVDGVQYPQPAVESRLAIAFMDYLKQGAAMDVADRRRKQRGKLLIETDDSGRHELTLQTAGSTRGLSMVAHIDQQKASLMSLEKLGLLESQRRQLEPILKQDKYLIIAACPPRQGLTTMLMSMVNRHDPYTQSVVALEEETEIELEGVTHEVIEQGSSAEVIERRLNALLRSDPAIVLLDRLYDASHAPLIADAATDLRFYLGLRQDDTFAALRLWLKAVGDMERAAASLGAIISQRLLRKLCPMCRLAYTPDPALLAKMNLSADRVPQLYKHSGRVRVGRDREETCPTCHGMGFRGRIGVFEVLTFDDEARRILAGGQLDQVRAHLRRQKMLYLQETALLKVVEGLTSISEISRALGGEKT